MVSLWSCALRSVPESATVTRFFHLLRLLLDLLFDGLVDTKFGKDR